MRVEDIKKLKDKVEFCLEWYPNTRNSDVALMIRVWKQFHSSYIQGDGKEESVNLDYLYELPREDGIKRVRAKVQNDDGKFLPTSWEVAEKRKINRDVWEKAMGYNRKPVIGHQETLI